MAQRKKAKLVKVKKVKEKKAEKLVLLDLGCGPNKQEGHIGVDSLKFKGVDVVMDMGKKKWPWKDNSVDGAFSSHAVEHLEWPERVHFFNELYRVLKKGGQAKIIVPHWASMRFYGDPTHKAPFSEFAWNYLNAEWRKVNAPHVGYTCDFQFPVPYGYNLAPWLAGRNQEFINFAITAYKEACSDMIGTLTK